MAIVAATRIIDQVSNSKDPKKDIAALVGDLSGVRVLWNHVLMATYIRPQKTAGGIIRPDANVAEDEWQGKVGLVLKLGPFAYQDDEDTQFHGESVKVGEWATFKVGDSVLNLNLRGYPCRVFRDSSIKLTVEDPNIVF